MQRGVRLAVSIVASSCGACSEARDGASLGQPAESADAATVVSEPPPIVATGLDPAELEQEREVMGSAAPEQLALFRNLRQRLLLRPTDAGAHAELGELYFSADHVQLAEREHLIAVQLDPNLGRSHLVLGELYLSRAAHARAIWHLERARRCLPGDPRPYEREALVRREAGDSEEARRLVEEGLTQVPWDADLRVARGLLLLDHERLAEAEEELRRALERAPDHLRAHLLLSQLLGRAGRETEARLEHERHYRLLLLYKGGVLAMDPPWPEWRRAAALARYHLNMGALDAARSEAERSLAEKPDNAEARAILAGLSR